MFQYFSIQKVCQINNTLTINLLIKQSYKSMCEFALFVCDSAHVTQVYGFT